MKKAFTLAEILITLSIIGVIASMTIPSLVQDIQDAQLKTAWKKAYADLNQAYTNIRRENGGSISEYFGSANRVSRPLIEKFRQQYNKINNGTDIYPELSASKLNYKSLAGTSVTLGDTAVSEENFQPTNGMLFYFRTYDPNYSLIWVDVNGYKKGPNILGKDLFGVTITKNWIKPMGAPGTGVENTCTNTEKACGYGFHSGTYCAGAGCSAEYLYQ